MTDLSNWSRGQVAISSGAIIEILKANLIWQEAAYKTQESQIRISEESGVAVAKNTEASIESEAEATKDQALGSIAGGAVNLGISAGATGVNAYKENQEVSRVQTEIDQANAFKADAEGGIQLGAGPDDLRLQEDKAALLKRGSFRNPRFLGEEGAQRRRAAFAHMPEEEKRAYLRDLHKDLDQLSTERESIVRHRDSKTQQFSAIGQATNTFSQGTGSMFSAQAKLEQAKAKFNEAIANYISQSSSIANQMLQSQASDAIAQKRAAMDMESQIASSQFQGSAA